MSNHTLLILFHILVIKEEGEICDRERTMGWKFYWPWSLLSCLGQGKTDSHQVEKTVAINQILSVLSSGCQSLFIRHGYRPKLVL